MYLKDLAKVMSEAGTATEDRPVTVKEFRSERQIYKGTCKELREMAEDGKILGWVVIEVLTDHDDASTEVDYNKGKIITVV